jgi:hypothetical protein
VAAAGVASALLCLRAWLGPFDWGPIHVNSPLVAEGVFSASIIALLLLGGKHAEAAGQPESGGRLPLLLFAAALCLVAFAFCWNLGDPFLADDYIMVSHAAVNPPSLAERLHTPGGDGTFRPVTGLWFDTVGAWAGWRPWRWHLLDLVRHLLDCGLLFALVWTLWSNSFLAFAATVLFGLHGTRPEAVTWNAATCDSLAVFFALAALLCAFRSPPGRISFVSLALTNIFVALAILSKESAYATPVLLLGFAFVAGRLRQRPVLVAFASTALLSAALLAYRWMLFHGPGGYVDRVTGRPQILSLKLIPTAKALLVRIWSTLLFPVNWQAEQAALLLPAVLLACTVFLYLAYAPAHPRTLVRVLLLTTALAVLPAIHLALIDDTTLGSRILYLPSLAFCVLWAHILGSIRPIRLRNVAMFAVIACLGCGLAHNLRAWHRTALAADDVCTKAAAVPSPPLPAMPSHLHGVFFFGGTFPDCVAMKRAKLPAPRY